MSVIDTPRLYTTQETADLLAVSTFTVTRLEKAEKLNAVKIGRCKRFSAVELNRYLASLNPDEQVSP